MFMIDVVDKKIRECEKRQIVGGRVFIVLDDLTWPFVSAVEFSFTFCPILMRFCGKKAHSMFHLKCGLSEIAKLQLPP